jgi:Tol biopolymer transport system component
MLIAVSGCSTQPLSQGSVEITLIDNKLERRIETNSETVLDLIHEQNIVLNENDRVSPPETAKLLDQMTVSITRIVYQMEIITDTVPYERRVVRDGMVPAGVSRLIQSGSPGLREMKYRLKLENDVQVERILISDTFITSPKDEIRVLGTQTEMETVNITGTLTFLNRQDAWVIRGNNQERRRLTSTGDLDGRVFELSPDGSMLLYSRAVTETEHFNEMWLVRTTEANPNAIPLSVQDVIWADWSPAQREIAWTTATPSDRPPGWRGENDLWTATLSSRNVLISRKQILEPEIGTGYGWWGTRYAWSPDGEMLAFSLPQSVGIINLDSKKRVTLHAFAAYKTYNSWAWNPAVSWSKDSLFIYSVTHDKAPGGGDEEESPVFDIVALDVTGVYSAEITSETGMWSSPTIAPDGTSILFGRAIIPFQSATSRYRLCKIDLDGSNQQCFYPSETEPGIEIPVWLWSPTGEYVAFIESGDLHIVSTDDWITQSVTDDGQITEFDWK